MLFKPYHIEMIRNGEKTVTRREWDDNYHGPNVGTAVAAKTDLFAPDDECDCYIRITGKREEALGDITEESARREGEYADIEEFREGYEEVYGDGAWDPEKVVTVVEFEYVGRQRPSEEHDGEPKPDRYAYSRMTDTWYLVHDYEDHGDGKLVANSKTEVDRSDVPQEVLDATEERGDTSGQEVRN